LAFGNFFLLVKVSILHITIWNRMQTTSPSTSLPGRQSNQSVGLL
jgi:hypothetical protein